MMRGWGGYDLPLGDLGEGRREEKREGKRNRWLIHGDDPVDSRGYHPTGIAACLPVSEAAEGVALGSHTRFWMLLSYDPKTLKWITRLSLHPRCAIFSKLGQ
jgi:hypothetical protein